MALNRNLSQAEISKDVTRKELRGYKEFARLPAEQKSIYSNESYLDLARYLLFLGEACPDEDHAEAYDGMDSVELAQCEDGLLMWFGLGFWIGRLVR